MSTAPPRPARRAMLSGLGAAALLGLLWAVGFAFVSGLVLEKGW